MAVDMSILGNLGPLCGAAGLTVSSGRITATAGTAITGLIPPWNGTPGAGNLNQRRGSPFTFGEAVTRINTVCYTTGGTAHTIGIMRPLNYAYFTKAFPKNTTLLDTYLSGDPGVYSTNYLYNNGVAPAQVADAAISSTNKYVAYQLQDGTWILDTIASGTYGSSLTLTTGTPNRATGQVLANTPFYYFGAIALSDPATGVVNPQTQIALSQTRDRTWADSGGQGFGIVSALNPGDPLMFYSPNGTNAGFLEFISGWYSRG